MTLSNASPLSPQKARFELMLLNAEAPRQTYEDFVVDAVARGVPVEIITRMKELWAFSKKIGNEVIAVGKIVVQKVLAFLSAHPSLSWGLLLGAAVAALVASIPLLGAVLAPLAALLGPVAFAAAGASMDKGLSTLEPASALIALAQAFFELLASVFNALSARWTA